MAPCLSRHLRISSVVQPGAQSVPMRPPACRMGSWGWELFMGLGRGGEGDRGTELGFPGVGSTQGGELQKELSGVVCRQKGLCTGCRVWGFAGKGSAAFQGRSELVASPKADGQLTLHWEEPVPTAPCGQHPTSFSCSQELRRSTCLSSWGPHPP